MTAQVILTVDLGYGDAGKGSVVDWLTREFNAHLIVRYNGGCQAAHNVIAPDGTHHTFAQFGSGTFVPDVRTYLSRYMLVAPDNFLKEQAHLQECGVDDAAGRVVVDQYAAITTPFHMSANRIRELIRNKERHGSCGFGIGETAADLIAYGERMLYAGDLRDPVMMKDKLRFIRSSKLLELENEYGVRALAEQDERIAQEFRCFRDPDMVRKIAAVYSEFVRQVAIDDSSFLSDALAGDGLVIFEGAQGVLLDEDYGFFPYVTRSHTTLVNADRLLSESGYAPSEAYRLGIARAYGVRHGPGPFVTEDEELTRRVPEDHNGMGEWQRTFRVGWFDEVAIKYALKVTQGVSGIVVTCLDKIAGERKIKIAEGYQYCGFSPDNLERFFVPDSENNIAAIRASDTPDLIYQKELTNLLFSCVPVYGDVDSDDLYDYLRKISADLDVPVIGASYGPTADDKFFIHSLVNPMDEDER